MAKVALRFVMMLLLLILVSGCAGTSRRSGPIHTGPIFGDTGTISAGEK